MGHYFRTWKRKLGVLTLVLAYVVISGWVCSFEFHDHIVDLPQGADGSLNRIGHYQGEVFWGNAIPEKSNTRSGRFVQERRLWQMPYWLIVLPLTLMSSYLLLSPQQKPKTPTAGV